MPFSFDHLTKQTKHSHTHLHTNMILDYILLYVRCSCGPWSGHWSGFPGHQVSPPFNSICFAYLSPWLRCLISLAEWKVVGGENVTAFSFDGSYHCNRELIPKSHTNIYYSRLYILAVCIITHANVYSILIVYSACKPCLYFGLKYFLLLVSNSLVCLSWFSWPNWSVGGVMQFF